MMRSFTETTRTYVEIDADADGVEYLRATTISVSDDEQTGTQLSFTEAVIDGDGYVCEHELSLSGDEFVELEKAAAEIRAREWLRRTIHD